MGQQGTYHSPAPLLPLCCCPGVAGSQDPIQACPIPIRRAGAAPVSAAIGSSHDARFRELPKGGILLGQNTGKRKKQLARCVLTCRGMCRLSPYHSRSGTILACGLFHPAPHVVILGVFTGVARVAAQKIPGQMGVGFGPVRGYTHGFWQWCPRLPPYLGGHHRILRGVLLRPHHACFGSTCRRLVAAVASIVGINMALSCKATLPARSMLIGLALS